MMVAFVGRLAGIALMMTAATGGTLGPAGTDVVKS